MEKLLKQIAGIPCTPFLYIPARTWVKRTLILKKINNLELGEDEFALYARVKRGKPRRKILVVSHLDHPGIALKNKNVGIALGSIGGYGKGGSLGYERVLKQLSAGAIPVRIYRPDGTYQQRAKMVDLNISKGSPIVRVEARLDVEINSHAVWDVKPYEKVGGVVKMINADNNAVTAVAMELLAKVSTITDIDLEVIFTYLEEVVQLSSMGIAEKGSTVFGSIDRDTIIINLDPMEVDITKTENSLLRKLRLKRPNYDGGIIVKVNDRDIRYGLLFENETNQAETLLTKAIEDLKVEHQKTITCNSTDAKSFVLFGLTPNITTIAVPCRWKHNYGPGGEFVPEEVYLRDLENTLKVLIRVLDTPFDLEVVAENRLSGELKKNSYGMSREEATEVREDQLKALYAVRTKLKHGVYFPRNTYEYLNFGVRRLVSKLI